ncbi:MAG TPA: hypothetical protein PKO18_00250 [Chitinophagales bacterium]|nr:hypothetical protein [Chitinophagales bacterium]HNL83631.1 hypothetical protein [Chitinophagales bacterium]
MNGKNDIFELIHALSSTEKSYFKKFAYKIKTKDSKDYLALFDALVSQKEYDELLLKKKLKHTKLFNNFSASKTYLINLIIDTLSPYQEENNIHGIILKSLSQIRFLNDKKAVQLAGKKIQQVKKQIIENELYTYSHTLFQLEIDLIPYSKTEEKYRNQLFLDCQYAERCVQNYSEYLQLKEEWIYFRQNTQTYTRDNSLQNTINEKLKHPLLQSADTALTTRAKYLYYYIRIGYYLLMNDLEAAYTDSCNQYVLLDKNLSFRQLYATDYINNLGNHLFRMINVNQYEDANDVIQKLESALKNYPDKDFVQLKRLNILYIERARSMHEKDFPRMLQNIEFMENAIGYFKIRKDIAISLQYDIILAYFYNDKFADALMHANTLLNHEELNSFKDLESYAHIIRLLCFIELNKKFVSDNLFDNLKKKLYRDKKLFKMENCMLRFLEEYANSTESKQKLAVLIQYKKEIEQLVQNPLEQNMLHYFNILWWMEAKINQKTMLSYFTKT